MRYAASSSDKPSGGYELVDEFYDAAVSGADAERGKSLESPRSRICSPAPADNVRETYLTKKSLPATGDTREWPLLHPAPPAHS